MDILGFVLKVAFAWFCLSVALGGLFGWLMLRLEKSKTGRDTPRP